MCEFCEAVAWVALALLSHHGRISWSDMVCGFCFIIMDMTLAVFNITPFGRSNMEGQNGACACVKRTLSSVRWTWTA